MLKQARPAALALRLHTQALTRRCLSMDPSERPTAKEVCAELGRMVQAEKRAAQETQAQMRAEG